MGIDCHGWVEVHDPTNDASEGIRFANWWSGIIRIDDLVHRNYQVFGYFFGVRNRFDTAVAPFRGMPADMSPEARRSLTEAVDSPDQVGTSWILWSEVLASNWQAVLELPRVWALLFDLVGRLAVYYGDDRVRLVIWFDSSDLLAPPPERQAAP